MSSNDNILAGISKIHAYRYAKEKQKGVKLGEKQYGDQTNDTRFESAPIPIGTSDFSLEFYMNSNWSNQAFPFVFNRRVYSPNKKGGISIYNGNSYINGVYSILMESPAEGEYYADSIYLKWQAPTADEKYLLTITRQGTTVKAYINGELKATKEQSEVKDLGDLQLAIANSSDVGFVRVWNYALSAEDVTAHYNNGDPMGYVVPKAMRRPETVFPSGVYTESSRTFSVNNTQNTSSIYDNSATNGFSGNYMRFDAVTTVSLYNAFWSNILKRAYPIKVTMEYRCNYDLYEGNTVQAFGRMLATANDGDAKVVAIYYPNSLGNANLGIGNNNAPDAWLEIRVTSIESVGLLAEYLPQNLMYGQDDKTIATSWLDSTKQLLWSDTYLPPLLQSKGGYDMVANGAPEVLFKESDTISFPGLIAAWSAKGKTNNDADRNILKDLTGNGHDITLSGLSYTQDSGYENPEYPDGLVLNGIDNYGICESISELSDITIIGKFVYNNDSTKVIGGFYATDYNEGRNAWILLQANSELSIRCGETNYQTFDISESIKGIPLIVISNRTTSNTAIKSYVNSNIFKTTSSSKLTGSRFMIGSSGNILDIEGDVKNRALKGVFYSAYVFNRSLSDDEMQTFVRKYIDPDYVLPTE